MLDAITPVILTYNEALNLPRTLRGLDWANRIVVVDSGSTDGTLDFLAADPRITVFKRAFDTHYGQWRFAVEETGIATPWILRLDADYQVTPELVRELAALDPDAPVNAYRVGFDYAVFSRRLVASLYPANTVLLRRGRFTVRDNGHTEAWVVAGAVGELKARIIHDDWKPATAWLAAQARYMEREQGKLAVQRHGLRDWLRLHPPLAPLAVFFYCLVFKGLVFSGRAGLHYTLQRTIAEAILSLMILEKDLRPDPASTRRQDDA